MTGPIVRNVERRIVRGVPSSGVSYGRAEIVNELHGGVQEKTRESQINTKKRKGRGQLAGPTRSKSLLFVDNKGSRPL